MHDEDIIGYSIWDTDEECYEYVENACFITDTTAAAEKVVRDGMHDPQACRVQPVTLSRIMEDYGCSGGAFAMESEAFQRFQQQAQRRQISFHAEPWNCNDAVTMVSVEGESRSTMK